MNFFIDFEATQFSNGIISVGCVSETGEEFSSLVYTKHKVTPFITELTGITPLQIKRAPDPEDVFSNLYQWTCGLLGKDEVAHFYCYGNCDKDFVRNNFKENNDFIAASMLAYLYTDLHDYAEDVKIHFGLCQHISLKKVYDYYMKTETVQQHDALDDAKMLKTVYENCQKSAYELEAFPEYQNEQFMKKVKNEQMGSDLGDKTYTVCRIKGDKTLETYPSLGAAVRWAYNQIPEGPERDKTSLKTIAKGIKRAAKDPKKRYYKFIWKMIEN